MSLFDKRENYIVWQQIVTVDEITGNERKILVDCIARNVSAKSQEEAIGKFILQTNDIEAKQKLTPICIKLDELRTIE